MLAKKNYSWGGQLVHYVVCSMYKLPDDFIIIPPLLIAYAITAAGDVNDVDYGDLNGTPST